MMKIVVVGSSNTDMIVAVPRIPKPGETILGGRFSTAAGGKGANQAVAAARAGGEVALIARVGNDLFGAQALSGFKADGIDATHVTTDPDQPSGVALILLARGGENSIAVAPGANAALSPRDVEKAEALIRSADILLMQLETPVETIVRAAGIAAEAGGTVILNPAPACPLDDAVLGAVTILTPNESEAELLTGIPVRDASGAGRAARALRGRGVKTVIVTMGSKGALLETGEASEVLPAFSVDAVDATAAGDVFNGALAVAVAEGKPLREAVRFANAAAALSVTRLGAQPSIPARDEIDRMLLRGD
ncbi:MAG: ribokinase [Candidatus Aureabacteria bacterium]|nr:ribokinase [Candidatus Auribacterota bacterium]